MNTGDTYMLRYNKRKHLALLLFELIKYEKKKDDFKPDFENDEFYNQVENLIKLLFNYIFNLSEENYTDCNDHIPHGCYHSSSSENLSDVLTNSSEDDEELSNFFSFKGVQAQEGDTSHIDNAEREYKLEYIQSNRGGVNAKESSMATSRSSSSSASNTDDNIYNVTSVPLKKDRPNKASFQKQNHQKESPHERNNNHMSEHFFNLNLKCNQNTQTIKEKKKVEKQILTIYYKTFSSNIIDMLLNSLTVEISDVILFFLFDNVGSVDDISSFFTKGHYTFEMIHTYIHKREFTCDETTSGKGTYKNRCENSPSDFKRIHQTDDTKSITIMCKEQEGHTNNMAGNFLRGQNIEERSPPLDAKSKIEGGPCLNQEWPTTNTSAQGITEDDTENGANGENEEENGTYYLSEILPEEDVKDINHPSTNNHPPDVSKLRNASIKEDTLIVEDFHFQLNKSSVLLNKFISILNVHLEKQKHFKFCTDIFFVKNLRLSFLEASKPWIFYWCIHTIYILHNDVEIEQKLGKSTFRYIKQCVFVYLNKIKNENGAFGGGLNQYTHIATTYAAVCVFIYLHDEENNFLSFLDRKKLHSYILKLKCKDGSFRLHRNGEIDMRGTYCAIAVCSMCHILTNQVKKNVEKYILSCQNYEGGFTSEKFQESHGGYTYCALATLCILGKVQKVNMNKLVHWLINKQGNLEGAFMGRTNKLVDACYSFWIGSIFFLINEMHILKQFLRSSKYESKKKRIRGRGQIVDNKDSLNFNAPKNFEKLNAMGSSSNGVKGEHPSIDEADNHGTINKAKGSDHFDCIDAPSKFDHMRKKNTPMTNQIHKEKNNFEKYKNNFLQKEVMFNMNFLKLYLLVCSQSNKGGMKDKPMEKVDYYHTCYALSGLSIIENYIFSHQPDNEKYSMDYMNHLNRIHILYNITVSKVYKSYTYFSPSFPLSENKVNHRVGKGAYLYLKRLLC
ncbi:farnesyltransferase beta subunit, putative [Plasmodium knowlesi strain H]|uniref:Protein farnesyltransferase subunit beta n=3 Tax=Plasmodium knowlesi TaxID=5850 RepID=A0A5K1VG54_PLAKH|nr:protein farnesyltransferase subunit beta, putative [Plasmodium knowlesi strain H]OTN64963.1 putative Farnesyltransferase beta subunit [Plasmodium knowlesi]CAA9988497.1 protein farnesyltransferase subunit beta, putative [Plasmodium knowlesi strain H]SBO19701.1 farnesyltransferase beta subunit, putative [Plasmodium knowlesi strain H]SBO20503.1 farnesyltransferase beta subunit, putative [Plasmodium knowlesi strain H]VVS77971.1 protein farnesyltransferase subunit beta, putative [Plasmodium know|eukprot:XP_002259474.1 farnesyltransferase beta subunit, putative [Plasmodium knowlesi strain H]